MDENASQETVSHNESSKDTAPTKESFLDKLKLKIPSFSFVQTLLIPAAVVVLILLIGGGGTFLIASNVFMQKDQPVSNISSVSELDTVQTPTPTLALTQTQDSSQSTPLLTLTPAPVASAAAGWTPYTFTQLFLTFSYPLNWFVNVGGTSGPPYLTVRNFSGQPQSNTQNQYTILISRLEQVGITTVSGLTTQLALNAASSTYINGVNMGQVTVLSATPTTVNGYQALERTVTYSAFPTTNYYELYILDGVSNVIRCMPQLDTTNGRPYFDTLISTIRFTNR